MNCRRTAGFRTGSGVWTSRKERRMGELFAKALYSGVGHFALLFLLLPAGLIFLGYVVWIVIETVRTLRRK